MLLTSYVVEPLNSKIVGSECSCIQYMMMYLYQDLDCIHMMTSVLFFDSLLLDRLLFHVDKAYIQYVSTSMKTYLRLRSKLSSLRALHTKSCIVTY